MFIYFIYFMDNSQNLRLIINPRRADALRRRHPWVFTGAVLRAEGEPQEGDIVQLVLPNGEHLARAHYQADGSIAARVLTFGTEAIDAHFWEKRLREAYLLRQRLGLAVHTGGNAFRLIHGEGDGLPGLIIDFYNGVAVIQCHSGGMYQSRIAIVQALQQVFGKDLLAVYDKSADTLPSGVVRSLGAVENAYLLGGDVAAWEVLESGCRFLVDWEAGQKTGFYLDQRDNRLLLERYSRDKRVLNLFCYTGGFSVFALRGGASWVDSIDSSARAIETARKNVALNGFEQSHEAKVSDVMPFLQRSEAGLYDLIVVDPPAFAKRLEAKHQAVQGYKRLNALALEKVASGGLLFTFSCSAVIGRQLFYDTITAAAIEAGRDIRVLHHLAQGADHPVNMFHPEGEYLKGLVMFVS